MSQARLGKALGLLLASAPCLVVGPALAQAQPTRRSDAPRVHTKRHDLGRCKVTLIDVDGGYDTAWDGALDHGGRLIAVGRGGRANPEGGGAFIATRFSADGSLDATWAQDGLAFVNLKQGSTFSHRVFLSPRGVVQTGQLHIGQSPLVHQGAVLFDWRGNVLWTAAGLQPTPAKQEDPTRRGATRRLGVQVYGTTLSEVVLDEGRPGLRALPNRDALGLHYLFDARSLDDGSILVVGALRQERYATGLGVVRVLADGRVEPLSSTSGGGIEGTGLVGTHVPRSLLGRLWAAGLATDPSGAVAVVATMGESGRETVVVRFHKGALDGSFGQAGVATHRGRGQAAAFVGEGRIAWADPDSATLFVLGRAGEIVGDAKTGIRWPTRVLYAGKDVVWVTGESDGHRQRDLAVARCKL